MIVGFVDLYVSRYTTKHPLDEAKKETERFDVSIEVKNEIPSDNRFCHVLKKQDIFLYRFMH